jgi:SET domain-containing protein
MEISSPENIKPIVKESTFLEGQVGVIAMRPYKKGEVIFLAKGPITSERSKYSFAIDLNRHIEPGQEGDAYNLGRYVNHSCDPTSITKIVEKSGSNPYIEVIARKDISKGEEITFDYATLEYEITLVNAICKCKTEKCRGIVQGFKDLPPEVIEEYKKEGILAEYLLKIKEIKAT